MNLNTQERKSDKGDSDLTEEILNKKGIHPEFGEITLKQLLATWVVMISLLCQITRVMAQYKQEIGPW
jgi:hypothetical protein